MSASGFSMHAAHPGRAHAVPTLALVDTPYLYLPLASEKREVCNFASTMRC
jgi:hypothetical protein